MNKNQQRRVLNNYHANLDKRGYSEVTIDRWRLFACSRCGSLVDNMDKHDKFHQELQPN